MQPRGISIVVPVYNEEESIVKVVSDIEKAMKSTSIPFEILIVNDGSTDRTQESISSAFNGNKHVVLVSHDTNRGVGIARNTGIERAGFNIVGMIDADETYPAEAIPSLFEKIGSYDMAVGARTKEMGSLRLMRRMAKSFIRSLANYLFNTSIPDLNSGLRVFKKELAVKYFYLLPPGHSWVSTITLAFLANGHTVCFVPISYFPRKRGRSSFHPVIDTYNYLILILRAITYFDPLKVFMPFFLILFIGGIVKTGLDILFYGHGIQESDIIILISAFLVLSVGLLSDLIVVQGKKLNFRKIEDHTTENTKFH